MSSYSAQQSSISENNRSRILQYLYRNGISSRAQIAKAIELTPAAITKITAKLLFRDVIEETGDMEGDKNRRSIGLNLNCAKYHVVGVKFARSLVQIAVFDLKCNRISLTDLPTVDEEHIPETVEQIRATVRQLIADDSSIVAVGMAVPGPYLVEEGRTALVSSMQGWRQVNFIKEFSEAFNVPVFVEQDARAGALAQFLFNPELSEGSLAYYLLGEGIGLGIIDNGSIYYGAHGTATEIGHISVDVNGNDIYTEGMSTDDKYAAAKQAALGYFEAAGYTVADGKITAAPAGGRMDAEVMVGGSGKGDHPSFMALTLASDALKEIGFNLIVSDMSNFAEMTNAINAGTADMFAMAWQATPDPDMFQIYHSQGGSNEKSYWIKDADLDELIMMARQSTDQTYRKTLYKQCLDIVADWAVEIPIYQRQNCVIFSAKRVNLDTVTPDITTYWTWYNDIELLDLQ